MKTDYQKQLIFISAAILLMLTLSCSGRSEKSKEARVAASPAVAEELSSKLFKMISPEENRGIKLGQQVKVTLAPENASNLPDSIVLFFDGRHVTSFKSAPWEYSIPSSLISSTGRKSLKATSYKGGKTHNTITRFLIVYSDIIPRKFGYKVVHTYPHDKGAFTQGLVYDNGKFFEGTGQETGSSLREVEPETGKVIRQHNLDASLFGEGITLYHDRLYQVTWTSKVGFIYNKSDFKLINKIYYATQGWGMTTIDDKIVMSDGTNVLYFYEPDMFTVTSKIEVYDNAQKRDSLNELEYINGEIWANIWMNDHIVRIDPSSGKVLGYINLKGILPAGDRDAETDVLNGIAYDNAGKRIFVTGKRWPKLFEIKVTE